MQLLVFEIPILNTAFKHSAKVWSGDDPLVQRYTTLKNYTFQKHNPRLLKLV